MPRRSSRGVSSGGATQGGEGGGANGTAAEARAPTNNTIAEEDDETQMHQESGQRVDEEGNAQGQLRNPQQQNRDPDQQEQEHEQEQEQEQDRERQQQQDQQQPASPPLPTRHTAVTPGPRAARLQELYAQRLQRTLARLGWDNLATCYPTVARRAENVLRQVQGQMVEKLGEKCAKEFDNILVSRQVVPKLNDLESLISDASRRRTAAAFSADGEAPAQPPTPPHLLPPRAILAAHLSPALAAHQSQLNARLQTTQAQNALLADEVRRQRAEMAELLDRLDGIVADVAAANDALRPVVGELAAESRQGIAAVDAASGGSSNTPAS